MKKRRTSAKKPSATSELAEPSRLGALFGDRRWVYWIPIVGILWVWLSSLSFLPVPWPDDSAFYFPAKDLFSWPPRWVMIPQAPFEPSYREWNFNTMPLFPILIGLARAIGIDGSHALKLLPLGGWLAGILFLLRSFRRGGASALFLVGAALALSLEPILRWSSVLIRPESLIGALGVFILFGYRFGWPDRFRERKFFHPVALALAAGAYLHFNAIHLVPIVLVLYFGEWKKIFKIGALTAAALVPWLLTIAFRPSLFLEQMALQFSRLSGFHNPWLSTWNDFTKALLADMGTPEAWGEEYRTAILLMLLAIPFLVGLTAMAVRKGRRAELAGLVWLLSASYLWHTKAEVWFTHFMHLAYWSWALLVLFEYRESARIRLGAAVFPVCVSAFFAYGQIGQTIRLEASETWHWSTYAKWVDCIDSFLVEEHAKRGSPEVFRVWDPTFPDITIALSRRHPKWEFTRTNDFYDRADLAVRHGFDVDAMVVTEVFRMNDLEFRGNLAERPQSRSVWMDWDSYFLNRLERDPKFKPNRKLCQLGRWDAFIYMNP
ncbi:MAG: hypothetical protein JST04_05325 [Bdellovibrionales bacterium]|nr:hypothetical protein [Bdellovibrionales bacterium]